MGDTVKAAPCHALLISFCSSKLSSKSSSLRCVCEVLGMFQTAERKEVLCIVILRYCMMWYYTTAKHAIQGLDKPPPRTSASARKPPRLNVECSRIKQEAALLSTCRFGIWWRGQKYCAIRARQSETRSTSFIQGT